MLNCVTYVPGIKCNLCADMVKLQDKSLEPRYREAFLFGSIS